MVKIGHVVQGVPPPGDVRNSAASRHGRLAPEAIRTPETVPAAWRRGHGPAAASNPALHEATSPTGVPPPNSKEAPHQMDSLGHQTAQRGTPGESSAEMQGPLFQKSLQRQWLLDSDSAYAGGATLASRARRLEADVSRRVISTRTTRRPDPRHWMRTTASGIPWSIKAPTSHEGPATTSGRKQHSDGQRGGRPDRSAPPGLRRGLQLSNAEVDVLGCTSSMYG